MLKCIALTLYWTAGGSYTTTCDIIALDSTSLTIVLDGDTTILKPYVSGDRYVIQGNTYSFVSCHYSETTDEHTYEDFSEES